MYDFEHITCGELYSGIIRKLDESIASYLDTHEFTAVKKLFAMRKYYDEQMSQLNSVRLK